MSAPGGEEEDEEEDEEEEGEDSGRQAGRKQRRQSEPIRKVRPVKKIKAIRLFTGLLTCCPPHPPPPPPTFKVQLRCRAVKRSRDAPRLLLRGAETLRASSSEELVKQPEDT
ncbi:hypothetical protein EYF80_057393 [Liparis tanakae]|uniref:Uncharacterized protein n=1 Tax=Liparis tanakae TaxID=230148 RepID=A0A4Z2EUX2_9TELE|nr:hypothetical protein EYF80_057393 [Liparis tanakae]